MPASRHHSSHGSWWDFIFTWTGYQPLCKFLSSSSYFFMTVLYTTAKLSDHFLKFIIIWLWKPLFQAIIKIWVTLWKYQHFMAAANSHIGEFTRKLEECNGKRLSSIWLIYPSCTVKKIDIAAVCASFSWSGYVCVPSLFLFTYYLRILFNT